VLRIFENGIELGPAHSAHANIRTLGQGRFSHWDDGSGTAGAVALLFSASDNTNPKTNGRTYTYQNGSSLPTPPTAPTGVGATATSSSAINLSWTDTATNEDGFKIERKTGAGAFAQIATVGPNITTYADSGLTANTAYSYQVRAYNTGGNSAYSNTASATTLAGGTAPASPTGLGATATSSTAITLSWTDASTNEDGFKIERKTGAGAFQPLAQVGPNITTYADSGLTASTAYSYQVRAYNTGGESAFSNTASATTLAGGTPPAPPTGLGATAVSSSAINLSWTDASTNEDGFKIERKTGAGAFAQIATVGPNITTYADSGLTASTAYSYQVRAYNTGGDSAYSNTASATTQAAATAPAAPTGLVATAVSRTQINLTWLDHADNEDGFKIERKSGGGSFAQIATVGANVTTYADTGLTRNTQYTYRVRAYNSVGNSGYSNNDSEKTNN
jgi:transcriptional regulator CtsR